jgi:nitroreductase/NAD-dependent dihydropyrimidine dehydrogenase PreA subunit
MEQLITVDVSRCKNDGMCVAECPSGCLESDADGRPVAADPAVCNGCGHCVAVCPQDALTHSRVDAAGLRPAWRDIPAPEAVDGMLFGRRSTRVWSNRPVTREVAEELLEVARYAPTAVNTQQVGWIVTVLPEKVRELAEVIAAFFIESKAHPKYAALWAKGQDAFLRSAPALAVAHAPADSIWGHADCAIALTFMEIAAVSRGLGTCWAGLLTAAATHSEPVRQALGLPEGRAVRGGLMLGYPKVRYTKVPPRNPALVAWL